MMRDVARDFLIVGFVYLGALALLWFVHSRETAQQYALGYAAGLEARLPLGLRFDSHIYRDTITNVRMVVLECKPEGTE